MRWLWVWLLCGVVAIAAALEPNSLTNGGMEGDADGDGIADGWIAEVHRHEGGEGTFALDGQTKVKGRFSQRISHASEKGWVRVSQVGISAQPNARYLFRCWVKADCRFLLIVYAFRDGDKYDTFVIGTEDAGRGTEGEWKLVTGVIATPADARSFKVSLVTDSKGTAWFDEAELLLLERPPYTFVPKVTMPPILDGDLSDPCWRRLEPLTPFLELGTDKVAQPPTIARMVATDTHLFIAFHCHEPNPQGMRLRTPESGEPAYQDDCVEVYLDPLHTHDGFFQFVVTPKGNQWSQRVEPNRWARVWWLLPRPVAQTPVTGWQSAAKIVENFWSVEVAIPFAILGIKPQPGAVIGINLCRSRKVGGEAQNSAFAYLVSDRTFQRPERFPHAVLFVGSSLVEPPLTVLPRQPQPFAFSQVLVPKPQRIVEYPEQRVTVGRQVTIVVPPKASALEQTALVLLKDTLAKIGCEVSVTSQVPITAASVIVLTTLERLPKALQAAVPLPQLRTFFAQRGEEAYALLVGAGKGQHKQTRIVLIGAAPRGVFNGTQTLRQMLFAAHTRLGALTLPASEIWDYPDLKLRGWHFIAPLRHELAFAEQWLDWLALMKFNTLVVEVDDRFPYERHPQVAHPQAMTREQWQHFLKRARQLGFEIIPQVQTFGHFRYVLEKPAYRHLSELSEPHPRWGLFAYCPSNPETYRVVFDLFDEVLELFRPRWFHIGHDEITFVPIGVCERCRATGKTAWQLLAEDIRRLSDYLKARGIERVAMWCDQLEPDRTGGYAPFFTHFAADLIPKDIVLFCWHYDARPTFPWLTRHKDKGFEVVACGWYHTQNVWRFAAESFDRRTLGYCGTTWYGVTGFATAVDLMSAVVLAAQNSWSVDNPLVEIALHPTNLAQDLWALVGERPLWRSGVQKFVCADLSSFVNATMFQRGEGGVVPDEPSTESRVGEGTAAWLEGVPFRLVRDGLGNLRVVALASATTPHETAPDLVAIPVNGMAKTLYLLLTTTARPIFTEDLYRRGTTDPRKVATLLVRYVDGMEVREELLYRRHLTEWNDRLGCSHARLVWQGSTRRGYLVTLCAYEWRNQRPEVPIAAIALLSANSPVQPALVGITLGQ